jgi:microcystin-dependent protein
MSVLLSPIGNGINFLTTTGLPLAGGQLYTYQAGSSTLLATYTDVNGLIPNTNPIVLGTDGRLPSELWFTQGYNYKLVLKDSNSNLIATYDNLYGILANASTATSPFTTGMILIWSGAIGTIPSGWVLCDGNNGAPDLRDRFVIGAGNTYSVSQTGGSANSIVVSHTHTATVTDPGHSHSYTHTFFTGVNEIPDDYSSNNYQYNVAATTGTSTTGITVANTSTGVSGTGANLPPYYALAYIFKT